MTSSADLHAILRRYWGYETFRPLQEQIVTALSDGRDVAAVLPTGGGKSLCYQLPAVLSGRTAVVISPLIALMQDQAAELKQMGIPAAVLNSSIAADEQGAIRNAACQGVYRLLYLSPERLARADTVSWLTRIPVAFFAIDEAHCISEWGHEFRPEYRELKSLRQSFPGKPIAAFTASATQRVRHDIIQQLALHDPAKYIRSFYRPNLHFLVRECDSEMQLKLLLAALRIHEGANVIVYAPTIASVEDTVDTLAVHGIASVPYHGQMSTAMRQRNQERWMSDETRVLVGTLAFGLGINKPSVRAVIHLSLPKSLEQYYQEAGRAGRDSEPADCILLWRKKDAGLLAHFIESGHDEQEKRRGWERYRTVRAFVESKVCRHRQICVHFGEQPKWDSCSGCDVCGNVADLRAEDARKAPTRKVGIKAAAPKTKTAPNVLDQNAELLEYLREWRRGVSVRENMPAFMILHDSSLQELARMSPSKLADLRGITGIGEQKAQRFGAAILQAIASFATGARAVERERSAESPREETLRLLHEGRTFEEIAQARGRRLDGVQEYVAGLVEKGLYDFQDAWVSAEKRRAIEQAATRAGIERLKLIKDELPDTITYGEIALVVATLKRALGQQKK